MSPLSPLGRKKNDDADEGSSNTSNINILPQFLICFWICYIKEIQTRIKARLQTNKKTLPCFGWFSKFTLSDSLTSGCVVCISAEAGTPLASTFVSSTGFKLSLEWPLDETACSVAFVAFCAPFLFRPLLDFPAISTSQSPKSRKQTSTIYISVSESRC